MSRCVLVVWLALAVLTGCGKGDSKGEPENGAAVEGSLPPESPRGGPMAEVSTNPIVIQDTGNSDATLQRLTQELRDYVVRTRTVPKNFDEFATQAQLRFPPAPQGKKYAIQRQAVVLVND